MCNVFNSSKENEIYSEQMRKLAMYFSSIDSTDIRENLIIFFEKASMLAKDTRNTKEIQLILGDKKLLKKMCDILEDGNLPYIASFSKYISKIDSIALKDQAIELIKMMAS